MVLKVDDGNETWDVEMDDFPIAVGQSPLGNIVFGKAAESSPALWLGHNDGRIFAQPDRHGKRLYHNDLPLKDPVWIEDGDRVRIGEIVIYVSMADGNLVVSTKAGVEDSTNIALDENIVPFVQTRSDDARDAEIETDDQASPGVRSPPTRPRLGRRISFAVLAMLLLGGGFVLTASPVQITIDPAPDFTSISGDIPPVYLLGRYLALPGSYRVVAEKTGYHRLAEAFNVAFGSEPDLSFKMRKLPGVLTIRSRPIGASVWVDGTALGKTPVEALELDAGRHEIRLVADRYKPMDRTVDIKGMGNRQTVDVTLQPGWGTLLIASVPNAATVEINDKVAGTTPFRIDPMEGPYRIVVTKAGWKPVTRDLVIKAAELTRVPLIRLEKQDGIIDLTTDPVATMVTLNGQFQGSSPVKFSMPADQDHKLQLTKPGFKSVSRTIAVGPGVVRSVNIRLQRQYGVIFISARPADAQLTVDGRPMGRASRRLRLTTMPHKIEITRPGYQAFSKVITPRLSLSSRLDVQLKTLRSVKRAKTERSLKGQKLVPMWIDKPVRFRAGASRREAGRRSNESQYLIELTRSFYISAREISNEDFRRYRPNHNSGSEQGVDLNEPRQPVASVSWDDAVRYLNWLSKKDGLPLAYREANGKMVAAVPMTTGYRLPTEAEWVYAARYEGGRRPLGQPLKYPWGNAMPPSSKIGNFADDTATNQFPVTLRGYSDGFLVAAPVGEFPANKAGIHDLGGNVSEWIHDFYDVHTTGTRTPLRDPSGPSRGQYHVVRGSSWRHGSVMELRYAYRDFAEKSRNDLGFRVARYAE